MRRLTIRAMLLVNHFLVFMLVWVSLTTARGQPRPDGGAGLATGIWLQKSIGLYANRTLR